MTPKFELWMDTRTGDVVEAYHDRQGCFCYRAYCEYGLYYTTLMQFSDDLQYFRQLTDDEESIWRMSGDC